MPAAPTTARLAALDELTRPARRRPLFRRTRLQDVVEVGVANRPGRDGDAGPDREVDTGQYRDVDAGPDRDVDALVIRRRGAAAVTDPHLGSGDRVLDTVRTLRAGGIPRWVAPTMVLVVVAIAAGSWILLRRPPTPEESLPRATAVTTAVSSTALDPTAAPSGAGGPATSSAPGGQGGDGADGPVLVHVAGAVARPGVVSLPAGSRAVDAVSAAGGMAVGADPDRVNLAAKLVDGERLVIPLVGQVPPVEVVPVGGGADGGTATDGAAAGAPVDLNSGTAEQLDALPGVGPATAAAIISHRQKNGPFTSVDGLLDVRGIGDAKLEALRDLVTVSSS